MTRSGHLPRILGLETEYAIVSHRIIPEQGKDTSPLSPAECIDELFRGTSTQNRARNRYLSNGGRLYVDLGSHPEYATAECSNARDVAVNDRAGEHLLLDLLNAANERLAIKNIRLHLLKTNTDSGDATFGCHENYQVLRETIESLDPGFISFLVTRIILTGAGGIDAKGNYVLSPRAFHIHQVTSADPTKQRPLIVTREEAHADAEKYARLQVTFGDSNMAETATEMKLRYTSTVLDYLEGGGTLADLALADPIAALRDTSRLGPDTALDLADGGTTTALKLQEHVLQRCEEQGSSELSDIRHMINCLKAGDSRSISDSVDWICKRGLLTQAAAKHQLDLASPLISRLNLAFHDIDEKHGLADRLRQAGNLKTLFDPEEIASAKTNPPGDTRARVRGYFISEADRLELQYSVSWTHVRLDSPPQPQIDLMDASSSQDKRVAALVEKMKTLPPQTLSALARLKAGLGPLY